MSEPAGAASRSVIVPARELAVVYLKGIAMGAADVVPGVSGATIALIVGIYDRLIAAITAIDPRLLEPAWRLHEPRGREAALAALEETDALFLGALGLGIATAVLVLSRVMYHAATAYPAPTYGFFFGLIAASALVLYRQIPQWTPRRVLVGVLGVALALVVTGLATQNPSHDSEWIFLTGMVAISAMVLPGVSGAFFLVLFGQYEYLTGTLTAFVDGLLALPVGGDLEPVLEAGLVVGIFGLGALIGLFTVAHAVGRALEAYRVATLVFLVSLMVGGLRLPAAEVLDAQPDVTGPAGVATVLAVGVGVAAVVLVDRYTDDLEYV